MNGLNEIVQTFSVEKKERFIHYLRKKNKRSDHKNIRLFQLLSENKWTSKEISQKLYKGQANGAYHALRKRLYKSLIDFTAKMSMDHENSTDMQIITYLLAARKFFLHKQTKLAYDILEKAELMAIEDTNYMILNEVYHTQIQYAYSNPKLNLDLIIKKFERNKGLLEKEELLNIAYSKLRQALTNFNYNNAILDFETLFNDTLKQQNIDFDSSMSLKSLYQIMALSSMSASISKNYYSIEAFLIKNYEKLKDHKEKNKDLFYHIEIVYMLANMMFRNKKFSASMQYLNTMENLMLSLDKKLYRQFALKFHLLKALNLNYSGNYQKAIKLLESVRHSKHGDIESLLDIHLSLTMFYFQQSDFSKAQRIYTSFYHTDNYYSERAGKEWVIKKNLMEILLHIELQNLELAESRIRSFKRSYYNYLKQINENRVITYLRLVESYFKSPELARTEQFQTKIEQSFDWLPLEHEDIFVMSYYAWLKSKLTAMPIYETTIELIKRAQSVN